MIIERHQDYVVDVGAIAAGDTAKDILQELDTDAPFCLRSIGAWRADRNDLTHAKVRYTDELNIWGSAIPLGTGLFGSMPSRTGLNSLPMPVYPQKVYQPGANVWCDIVNSSANEWTGVKLLLRGVKLFEAGAIYSPAYPDHYRSLPFAEQLLVSIPANTQTLRNETLALKGEYDFVIQSLAAVELATSAQPLWSNLGIKIKDHWGMAYSNDYVQLDWLFSSRLASRPGLLYPEIYMQANDNLYFDIQRTDAAGAGPVQLDFRLCLAGERVHEVKL